MKGHGWTEEEDAVLRQRYPLCLGSIISLAEAVVEVCAGLRYREHLLYADLLVGDLPEPDKRTSLQVAGDMTLFAI